MRSPHRPKIVGLHGGRFMVECLACRSDHLSEVPIGIGMPLPDRLTAERLAENHTRRHDEAAVAASKSYGRPPRPGLVVARRR